MGLKYNLLLHLIVFIFGFTGILGELITVQGTVLVWYRTLIAAICMGVLMLVLRKRMPQGRDMLAWSIGTGFIVAAHWVAFFESIKMTNVSIALACLSTSTLFVSILEPIFLKTRISVLEVVTGLIIMGGIGLILNVEFDNWQGILVGLASAFFSALFTVINKKLSSRGDGFAISFTEIISGWALLSLFFLVTTNDSLFQPMPQSDWWYLILLGTICTAFAFYGIMLVLKHLTAYNVVLAINLEPIYGFLLAAWIFHEYEQLHPGFYAGASIIIGSVMLYSFIKMRLKKVKLQRLEN